MAELMITGIQGLSQPISVDLLNTMSAQDRIANVENWVYYLVMNLVSQEVLDTVTVDPGPLWEITDRILV